MIWILAMDRSSGSANQRAVSRLDKLGIGLLAATLYGDKLPTTFRAWTHVLIVVAHLRPIGQPPTTPERCPGNAAQDIECSK